MPGEILRQRPAPQPEQPTASNVVTLADRRPQAPKPKLATVVAKPVQPEAVQSILSAEARSVVPGGEPVVKPAEPTPAVTTAPETGKGDIVNRRTGEVVKKKKVSVFKEPTGHPHVYWAEVWNLAARGAGPAEYIEAGTREVARQTRDFWAACEAWSPMKLANDTMVLWEKSMEAGREAVGNNNRLLDAWGNPNHANEQMERDRAYSNSELNDTPEYLAKKAAMAAKAQTEASK